MRGLLAKLELPLFARELTELSAKKRTYVIRVVYAAILLWIGIAALSDQLLLLQNGGNRLAMLGSGQVLFSSLLRAQMLAVHIFMPALACAAITAEKERNTLGLLLLTKLGPWRILVEKLFSRLLPMITCLLLSVPILALSYTLGGLTFGSMVTGIWLLLATCVQIACLTLMCSTFFKSTVGAFIASYLLQIVIFFGAMMLDGAFSYRTMWGGRHYPFMEGISGYFVWEQTNTRAMPMAGRLVVPSANIIDILWTCLWRAKGVYLMSLMFFLGARFFLIRRAVVLPKSRIMKLFKALDRFFVWLNNRAGGVTLVKDVGSLPADKPIAWREVTKKSLGTARYLFRVFLVLELPTALICLMAAGVGSFAGEFSRLAGLSSFLWAVTALVITIKASTLVASERASETLDVLLTTTMTSGEIMRQKCAGLRRVLLVTAIPLLTVIAFGGYLKGFPDWSAVLYCVWGVLQVVVYLPLIAWVAVWVGLRMGSQTKSIFVAMALLLFWAVLPGILGWGCSVMGSDFGRQAVVDNPMAPGGLTAVGTISVLAPYAPILVSGPSAGIAINEFAGINNAYMRNAWFVIVPFHIAFHAVMWFLVRRRVLATAGLKLGRGEVPGDTTPGQGSLTETATTDGFEPQHAMS